MKKYIVLGWCGGMGGGQIYTMNRCESVRKMGWTPIVVYNSGRIVIDSLKQYQNNLVPEIIYPPCFFTVKKRRKIIDKLMSIIDVNTSDDIFIESEGVRFSYWGEILAKELKCKHFAFLLEAYFPYNDNCFDFFYFKIARKEVACIHENSYDALFKNSRYLLKTDEKKSMKAHCSNSLSEATDYTGIDFDRYNIKIAHVGRITKPYVSFFLSDVFEYITRLPSNKQILLVMIGAELDSRPCVDFKERISGYNNVDFICTGFLFPIPANIIRNMDVLVGSSGCVTISNYAGKEAIRYLDDGISPVGISRIINGERVTDEANGRTLSELIKFTLSKQNSHTVMSIPGVELMQKSLREELTYMMQPSSKEYYNTREILPLSRNRKMVIKSLGKYISIGSLNETIKKTISICKNMGIKIF